MGFSTGIVGLVVCFMPFGLDLEENIGLDLLFKLRGVRQPPSDVIIVSLDKASSEHLTLPENPRKWPRSLHARLIKNLVKEGASVIVFDIFFEEARSIEDDNLFAEAISEARKVVLCEYLKSKEIPLTDKGRPPTGDISIVRLERPIPLFAQSAVALAPFPLPKIPVRISRYWTFKTEAGDTPTLPVVAFQIFAMQSYDEFINLLEKVGQYQAEEIPRDKDKVITTRGVEKLIRVLRDIFENEPLTAERMLEELKGSKTLSVDPKKHQMIKSLIKMYKNANSQYLNFYGPLRTITTVPYYQILQLNGKNNPPYKKGEQGGFSGEMKDDNKQMLDLKGKVVFVGLSESIPSEQKDGFYTVFSQPNGMDISGVEIAATAFANLIEDMPVRPVDFRAYLAIIFIWGTVLGIICHKFPTVIAALSVMGLSVLYLIIAEYQFKTSGVWSPLVVPLFLQVPLAFFASVMWKYIDSNKERRNIRKAFGYYLPGEVVDQLAKNIADLKASNKLVYGICLYTDAAQYTSLSETMDPKELGSFMNKYYETVFKPVRQHSGTVSDVIGDSMLAIWVDINPDNTLTHKSCLAALDIVSEIHHFNQSSDGLKLPTRIGLHSGHIMLGNIGASGHYEYRPVGDIVNTATRIEGLNKYVGTRILVSKEMIDQLDGFLTREIGEFILAGKSKPIEIYELICRLEESNEAQSFACSVFAEALDAFRRQSWDKAIEKFYETIKILEEDGPSRFYLKQCEYYKKNPPGELWDGLIQERRK